MIQNFKTLKQNLITLAPLIKIMLYKDNLCTICKGNIKYKLNGTRYTFYIKTSGKKKVVVNSKLAFFPPNKTTFFRMIFLHVQGIKNFKLECVELWWKTTNYVLLLPSVKILNFGIFLSAISKKNIEVESVNALNVDWNFQQPRTSWRGGGWCWTVPDSKTTVNF